MIGDGSYEGLNKTLITVAPYEGRESIILNGTLPNGTEEAALAAQDEEGAGMSLKETAMRSAGYWALAGAVGAAVFFG